MLRDLPPNTDERLIVGLATGDDAAVFRLSESAALVQTLDFFTPVVDDPYRYGQIAAANSLSDVYAMGGRPLTAMNIVCFPIHDREPAELAAILRGGADKLAEAGVALVGGHSVDDPEPKYGLSVTGLVHPDHIATNAGARQGDSLILTKPLGTGIVTTAAKFDACPPDILDMACASMSLLNAPAAEAMRAVGIGPGGVHAATDITGFALLGHLYHMARASGVRIELQSAAIPVLPGAEELAASGNTTRGGTENAEYLAEAVTFGEVPQILREILFDPQTSGGLAISVAAEREADLLSALIEQGVEVRAVIGRVLAGLPRIDVR